MLVQLKYFGMLNVIRLTLWRGKKYAWPRFDLDGLFNWQTVLDGVSLSAPLHPAIVSGAEGGAGGRGSFAARKTWARPKCYVKSF